ncbi:MAG: DMT family transporter [Pseudomonadota bacterium]
MENLRGIVLMVAAMAGFAVSDGFVKALTESVPAGQLLVLFGTLGTLLLAAFAWMRGRDLSGSFLRSPIFLGRFSADMLASACIVGAFATAPLSLVAAIMQVSPLFAAALAALLLGERLGPRRLIAIGIGLVGVLLIVEPWGAQLAWGAILAALGSFFLALRDVLTRMAPASIPSEALVTYGYLAIAPGGLIAMAFAPGWDPLTPRDIWLLIGGILSGIAGYTFITLASRMAEVTAIAPFRYSRLVFALLIGILIFNEALTPLAFIGATLIIGSGLFVFWREARLARR